MASTNRYPGLEPRVVALVRHHAGRLASLDRRLEREDMEQELHAQLHARAHALDQDRASEATFQDRIVRHRALTLPATPARRSVGDRPTRHVLMT